MNRYRLKQPQQIDQTEESYLDHHRIWLYSDEPTQSPIAKYVVSSYQPYTFKTYLVQEPEVLLGKVDIR
jgi:hypothetical protein